jgi:hypothetical protein
VTTNPGYKTTEFLVAVLTAVGALAAALTGNLAPRYAAIAASISTGAYALARGLAKFGAPPASQPKPPVGP